MTKDDILAIAKPITFDEYVNSFYKNWQSLEQCFRKTETLSSYGVDDAALVSFKNKDFTKLRDIFSDMCNGMQSDNNLLNNSIVQKRLRYVNKPLSDYVLMESYSYKLISNFGQKINVTEDNNAKDFGDFIIFDNKAAFFLEFNELNEINNIYLLEKTEQTKDIINYLVNWFDEKFHYALPSENYFQLDSKIVNLLC